MPNQYEGRIRYTTWEKIGRGLQTAGLVVAVAPLAITAEAVVEKGVEAIAGHEIVSDNWVGTEYDRAIGGIVGFVVSTPIGLLGGVALGEVIEGHAKSMQKAPQRDMLRRLDNVIDIWDRTTQAQEAVDQMNRFGRPREVFGNMRLALHRRMFPRSGEITVNPRIKR